MTKSASRLRTAAVATLFAVLAVGCGSSDSEGVSQDDHDAVKQQLTQTEADLKESHD